MKTISREEAAIRLVSARETGWFCHVTARRRTDDPRDPSKKKGALRTFNCRGGVKKWLRGGELPYDETDKEVIVVWDLFADKPGYRSIAIEGITLLKIDGKEFLVK